jgi:hypothetical protein
MSNVVLPHPDGPTKETNSPSSDLASDVADRNGRLAAGLAVAFREILDFENRHGRVKTGVLE